MKKKPYKINVVVTCQFTVPFWSYGSKTKDNKAKAQIRKWIKSYALANELAFVPLRVEKDENGHFCDDSTSQTRMKVF